MYHLYAPAPEREWIAAYLSECTNRQLLRKFRDLIFEHAWILPCTQSAPFTYLGDPARPQLRRLEWEIGEYAAELTKRGYDISKIGF